jgi:hypothetical protein
MEALEAQLFQLIQTSTGEAVNVPNWAAPFIKDADATDVANQYIDLPDITYLENSLFVYKNGVLLAINLDYTLAGNRITFIRRLRLRRRIQARYQTP